MTRLGRHALALATAALGSGALAAGAAPLQMVGLLLLGPSCSGPEREGQPCPSLPYALMPIQLRNDAGAVVSQAVSDDKGRFVFSAAPGRYRVVVVVPKVTRCPSPEVELPPRGPQPLVIDCDSGRR